MRWRDTAPQICPKACASHDCANRDGREPRGSDRHTHRSQSKLSQVPPEELKTHPPSTVPYHQLVGKAQSSNPSRRPPFVRERKPSSRRSTLVKAKNVRDLFENHARQTRRACIATNDQRTFGINIVPQIRGRISRNRKSTQEMVPSGPTLGTAHVRIHRIHPKICQSLHHPSPRNSQAYFDMRPEIPRCSVGRQMIQVLDQRSGLADPLDVQVRASSTSPPSPPCTHASNIPGHLTSMKYELGDCTNRFNLCFFFSDSIEGLRRSMAS